MAQPLRTYPHTDDARTVPLSRVDPLASHVLDDPYPTYAHLRDLGPAVWIDSRDLWAVTGFAAATQVLTQPEVFTSTTGVGLAASMAERMGPGEIILHTDPPRHTVLHEILLRQLGRAGLARRQPAILATAAALIADALATEPDPELDTGGPAHVLDVVPMARQFAVTTAADLAGLPADGRDVLATFSRAAFTALGPNSAPHTDAHATALDRLAEMADYLVGVVRGGHLADHSAGADIAAAAAAERIDTSTIVQLLAALVTAGIDTTITAISNLFWLLGNHPVIWSRLHTGTVSVADTLAEALRVESPIRAFTRTATTDTMLGHPAGPLVRVRAGERVLVCFGAANRDPDRWSDPDRFNPARPRQPHLAFGRGLHSCLGQALATAQLHAIIRALLAGVDELAVVPHLTHRDRHPVINGFAQLVVALRPAKFAAPA
jgi:cytochrome P450